jgi:DNA-binding transcriptional regulator YiaG
MKGRKKETFVYKGLGFPILLVDVPMRKRVGEWTLDIDFDQLEKCALLMLVEKPAQLTGKEIRFIRHYLNMSTHKFADILGVTHVAILNWEKDGKKMNVGTEYILRLYVLNHLKVTDKEFRSKYLKLDPKSIAKRQAESPPLEIDAEKIAC